MYLAYLSYLAISIVLTVSVGRILQRNGRVFLLDAFHGNLPLTESVANLLLVGFYLFISGDVALSLSGYIPPFNNPQQLFDFEASRIGWLLLLLGISHFFNMLILSLIRHGGRSAAPTPATA